MRMRRTRSWTWPGHRNRLLLPFVTLAGSVALATPARASEALRVHGGDEGPDSTEATPADGVGPRDCTVRFEHDKVTLNEDVSYGLLFVIMAPAQCYTGSTPVVLQHEPYGGATTPGDYRFGRTSISFEDNTDGTEAYSVYPVDDGIAESGEGLYVSFKSLPNGVTAASPDTQDIELKDAGGKARPSLSINDATVDEDDGSATLTVTLTGTNSGTVTVDYATSNGTATAGSDYTSKNGSLSFSGSVKTHNISIAILDDSDDENNENFTVTLSNWENTEVSDRTGKVTIRDDDEEAIDPPSAPRSLAAAPGDGEVTLTWVAPANDGGGTISGYRYRHAKESGSYPKEWTDVPGGSGARRVTVGDLANGTLYKFQVHAENEAGAGNPASAVAAPVEGEGTPSLSVSAVTISEDNGSASVKVSLSPPSTGTVTVEWTTEDGTATAGQDYADDDGMLTFSPGDTEKQIRLSITDDGDQEGSEMFSVTLSNPTGDAEIESPDAEITIIDDDEETVGVPSVPRSLAGFPGDSEVTLTWIEPADDGGGTITGYEHRYAEEYGSYPVTWSDVPGEGGATEVAVDGLTNDTPYKFQVRAVNSAGVGDLAETTASPVDPGEPPALSIADVTVNEADGTARVRVSLEPPERADGDDRVDDRERYRDCR